MLTMREPARGPGPILSAAGAWCVALGLLAVTAPRTANAAAQCYGCIGSMRQVTQLTQGDVWATRLNSQRPPYVTFTSDGDVMGPGSAPGHREVYLYGADGKQLTRVTTTVGGESYDGTRLGDDGPRGQYLAFVSTGDLDPTVGNADGSPELFLWEHANGAITQVTDSLPPVAVHAPFISDSGKCVTFHSNGDLDNNDGSDPFNPGAGFSNPDGSVEAFMYEVPGGGASLGGGVFTQMSNGPPGTTSSDTAVGGFIFPRQCATAVFHSDHDQMGLGAVGRKVYVYDRSHGTHKATTPLTVAGQSLAPFVSGASNIARGPFVLFHTNSDVFGNGSSGFEVFRFRDFHPLLVQYTFSPTGDSENPVITDGGGLIGVQSSGELLDPRRNPGGPFNADGNREIFLLRGRSHVQQVTDSVGCENTNPGVHGYIAEVIGFRSTCDLLPGHNPNGRPQVFVYRDVPRNQSAQLSGCTLANACCHEDTCYDRIAGPVRRPPRPYRAPMRIP
jgi:hypothetical protein